jgi:hypothetical protein
MKMNKSDLFQQAADILKASAIEVLTEAVTGDVSAIHVTGQIRNCVDALRNADFLQGKATMAGIFEESASFNEAHPL